MSLCFNRINPIEVQNNERIPTYSLLKKLEEKKEYSGNDFYFLVASDLLKDLQKWDNGPKLKEEAKFLILKRPGFEINPEDLPKNCKVVEGVTSSNLSSTELRKRVKMADKERDEYLGIYGLTTYGVIEMIKGRKMYF